MLPAIAEAKNGQVDRKRTKKDIQQTQRDSKSLLVQRNVEWIRLYERTQPSGNELSMNMTHRDSIWMNEYFQSRRLKVDAKSGRAVELVEEYRNAVYGRMHVAMAKTEFMKYHPPFQMEMGSLWLMVKQFVVENSRSVTPRMEYVLKEMLQCLACSDVKGFALESVDALSAYLFQIMFKDGSSTKVAAMRVLQVFLQWKSQVVARSYVKVLKDLNKSPAEFNAIVRVASCHCEGFMKQLHEIVDNSALEQPADKKGAKVHIGKSQHVRKMELLKDRQTGATFEIMKNPYLQVRASTAKSMSPKKENAGMVAARKRLVRWTKEATVNQEQYDRLDAQIVKLSPIKSPKRSRTASPKKMQKPRRRIERSSIEDVEMFEAYWRSLPSQSVHLRREYKFRAVALKAIVLHCSGRLDDAIELYLLALKVESELKLPKVRAMHVNLGCAYHATKMYASAISEYLKVLSVDSNDVHTRCRIAKCLYALGDFTQLRYQLSQIQQPTDISEKIVTSMEMLEHGVSKSKAEAYGDLYMQHDPIYIFTVDHVLQLGHPKDAFAMALEALNKYHSSESELEQLYANFHASTASTFSSLAIAITELGVMMHLIFEFIDVQHTGRIQLSTFANLLTIFGIRVTNVDLKHICTDLSPLVQNNRLHYERFVQLIIEVIAQRTLFHGTSSTLPPTHHHEFIRQHSITLLQLRKMEDLTYLHFFGHMSKYIHRHPLGNQQPVPPSFFNPNIIPYNVANSTAVRIVHQGYLTALGTLKSRRILLHQLSIKCAIDCIFTSTANVLQKHHFRMQAIQVASTQYTAHCIVQSTQRILSRYKLQHFGQHAQTIITTKLSTITLGNHCQHRMRSMEILSKLAKKGFQRSISRENAHRHLLRRKTFGQRTQAARSIATDLINSAILHR